METVTHTLRGVLPHREGPSVKFVRLEMQKKENSPIALVWYKTAREAKEKGARIDLQKQVFLDDFGTLDRGEFVAEARLIVQFLHSLYLHSTRSGASKKSKLSKKSRPALSAGASFTD